MYIESWLHFVADILFLYFSVVPSPKTPHGKITGEKHEKVVGCRFGVGEAECQPSMGRATNGFRIFRAQHYGKH